MNVFIENEAAEWQDMGGGVRRKIMAYDNRLMLLKVEFQEGSIGALHRHPHSQITHIESGSFEVEIGGVKKMMKAGDAFYIPPDTWHGVLCTVSGVLIDVFSPCREDFISIVN